MGGPCALTICIPTIPARRSVLSRLLFTIEGQLTDDVEVLIADGATPMGDKLNRMFAMANGHHVVAVDDDDLLSENYVDLTTKWTAEFDFLGHYILWLENGRFAGIVKHSLHGDPSWGSLNRGVSPKCPVRTELARQVEFGNHYTADREWSTAIHALCETGTYLPVPLYIYDHWDQHMVGTEPDDPRFARPQRDVGMWPFDPERFTWI